MRLYYVVDDTSGPFEFDCSDRYDLGDKGTQGIVTEDMAANYHSQHDGWESIWPCKFEVSAREDMEEVLFTLMVDREAEPVFSAREWKDPNAKE